MIPENRQERRTGLTVQEKRWCGEKDNFSKRAHGNGGVGNCLQLPAKGPIVPDFLNRNEV